jgi:pimeloyl-ACP methyl ester carboxylesterase
MRQNNIEIGENRVAWYKTGTGTPIIILHGWGSDSAVMKPIAGQIADIRTCYLIDLPGFGKSHEPKKPWGTGDYALMVRDFANIMIPDETFDLLVHSYGGRVALKLLSDTAISGRIGKVIFTGAAGLKPKRSLSFYLKKYTAKTLKFPFLLLPSGLRERGLNRLRKTALWKKLGSSDYQKLSGVMRQTFVKSVNEYMDHLLPGIRHEILLIWGRDDTATPLEQGERFDKALPESALVVIEDAGHYAFLDKPSQFAAIARAYLAPKE